MLYVCVRDVMDGVFSVCIVTLVVFVYGVQANTLCRYCCMYLLAAFVLVRVDVMVMSSA